MQRPVTQQSYGVEDEWDLARFQDLVRRGEVRKFTPLRLLVANLAFVVIVLLALIASPVLRYIDGRRRSHGRSAHEAGKRPIKRSEVPLQR